MLTFGTGVGGGIIYNSEIFKGNGNAGEIGRILINEKSYLEDVISAKVWTKKCQELYEINKETKLSNIFYEEKVVRARPKIITIQSKPFFFVEVLKPVVLCFVT